MSVVVSLLRAIDHADGEALVMHVGEKPYVVTASGPAEIAAKPLTVPAMTGMLDQLLPPDSRQALNEVGAVEYHMPPDATKPGLRYSVVAARGGDDIWIELRRRKEEPEPVPVAVEQALGAVAVAEPPQPVEEHSAPEPPPAPEPVLEPEPELAPEPVMLAEREPEPVAVDAPEAPEPVEFDEPASPEPASVEQPEIAAAGDGFQLTTQTDDDFYGSPSLDEDDEDDFAPDLEQVRAFDFSAAESEPEPAPVAAVVVPMARVNVRLESAPRQAHVDPLHHLLQVGASHGASALYVAAKAKPSLRVDGEIHVLEEPPLTEQELEAGLRALIGARAQGATFPIADVEPFDVPDVGRVQYFGFRDHRGIGAMFKMLPARAVSAQHSGLAAPIQALCTEPEGLVLVAGGRASGKSTLVAALVDQINRTRRDHVITVESQIQFVHENQTAFVSQREARDDAGFVNAVRTAIHEAPDVLVLDDVANADVARAALDAAMSGQMVIASVTAASTASALERFIAFFGDQREVRSTLAEHLRGVIMQTLLRKTGGGRAAAREVLVNVPSVATLIANGQFDQLGSVLNSGRKVGMVPLNDALLTMVQGGALDVRQAYRKSPDQSEFVTMLNKAGMDTSFAERLN